MRFAFLLIVALAITASVPAQSVWETGLDGRVAFYQTTDFGLVVAGTENSLYALDGRTGERVWRRKSKGLDETSVVPVPSTDVILVSNDLGDKSRLEAIDLLSGETLWRSDKVKGDVMQLAVEPQDDLVALVMAKKAKGKVGEEFKRSPVVHVFRLSTGDELWKKELDSDVQMMPSRFDTDGDVPYTLDNYRAPLILDGRLYLFYEGVTSYDARTGKEGEREKFKVNEGGLALTEADPVFDDKYLYTSGRGKIRAVNRRTFKVEWEAKDLGVTPEMAVANGVVYVRTGGRFTRFKDGETEEKGPFGVSAIDARTGKTLWRWKGADKGLTNFAFADQSTIVVADKDDLVGIDATSGKKKFEIDHDVEKAQFVIINESGAAVVGGQEEIAAFRIQGAEKRKGDSALWRVRHKAPGRGVFRVVTGIALRAAALYFRYGGLATSALNLVRGASAARSVLSLRWSGLGSRFSSVDLTTLASNSARSYVSNRITVFGVASRTPGLIAKAGSGLQVMTPSGIRAGVVGTAGRVAPSASEVQESVLERLDPTRKMDRLSSYLLRRQRLAELRGNFMYFYTDLKKPFDRKGLVGVNINTGADQRFILVSDPDARFTNDEASGLLYSADGGAIKAFDVVQ